MRSRRFLVILGSAILVLALGAGAVSAAHVATLSTSLTGSEEIPGPGDPDGKGSATLDIYVSGVICYSLKIKSIDTPNAAHIHEARAGVAGPVVVPLPLVGLKGKTYSNCVSTTPEQAADILETPTDYYVNIHNVMYPAGAIRGQLGD